MHLPVSSEPVDTYLIKVIILSNQVLIFIPCGSASQLGEPGSIAPVINYYRLA
jgi:hypothetical protein